MSKVLSQESLITFLIDPLGIIKGCDDVDLSRLGIIQKVVTDKSVLELYEDHPIFIGILNRALGGEHVTTEIQVGSRLFSNSYTPVSGKNREVDGIIVVSVDITETKRAEEVGRKSEFRMRALFDAASDAIFTMDNKTFIDCNEATFRIFQCTREQIVGQTPYRFSPTVQPDGRSSEESAMEKINAALSGRPQFFEWRHIHYDGTPFEAEVSLNRLDIGNEVFIQAMVRDVTERKRAEEENKRLALVANTTTNMVVIADGSGKIEWVNPAFTRITGYSLQEVMGKSPGSVLCGPASDKKISTFMKEKLEAGLGFKDVEIINYTKQSIPYWVSIEVLPVHNKQREVVQFIAVESDITERKATQQALIDRHEEVMKINAELDRFVYSASHDLRAPIASLLGLIEVARLEKNVDAIGLLLDMQKKSLLRLDKFIEDIVDHSRNTRLAVESESVNFETIIHTVFEQLQFMDNVNRIRKVISIKQENQFYSSPTRLDIIFNNLISNAIKYADVRKTDPLLEVTIAVNHQQAEIRIRDNGEGIPDDAQPKIFDMFYRASGKGTGSGLGLYIVKEAIQKIGGTINVHSEFGAGTEFIVVIPNMKSEDAAQQNSVR